VSFEFCLTFQNYNLSSNFRFYYYFSEDYTINELNAEVNAELCTKLFNVRSVLRELNKNKAIIETLLKKREKKYNMINMNL
jgi:hypothetical protein